MKQSIQNDIEDITTFGQLLIANSNYKTELTVINPLWFDFTDKYSVRLPKIWVFA